MFGEDDADIQELIEKQNRYAAAVQSIQVQKQELTDNIGGIFSKFGIGIAAVGFAIYWFLIRR